MSLSYDYGKKLLREIVGGAYGFRNYNGSPVLGLSLTKPLAKADSTGSYNVTEPAATTSYKRITLGGQYFVETTDPQTSCFTTETDENGNFVTAIHNTSEIHFQEAGTSWGIYKYFAIFENSTSTAPIYSGELVYAKDYNKVVVTSANFADLVATNSLYLEVETGTETKTYIKITTNDEFDAEATYKLYGKLNIAEVTSANYGTYLGVGIYTKEESTNTFTKVTSADPFSTQNKYYQDGLFIEGGTVPLVRSGALKVSVQ